MKASPTTPSLCCTSPNATADSPRIFISIFCPLLSFIIIFFFCSASYSWSRWRAINWKRADISFIAYVRHVPRAGPIMYRLMYRVFTYMMIFSWYIRWYHDGSALLLQERLERRFVRFFNRITDVGPLLSKWKCSTSANTLFLFSVFFLGTFFFLSFNRKFHLKRKEDAAATL